MFHVVNIINHLCNDFRSKWQDFCTMYHHHNKKNLNSKKMKFFCALLKEFQKHVLKKTQIIVCTVNNANNYKLHKHFHSVIIFVNEVTKMTELDIIILLIWNLKESVIFIDDHFQLKFIILSQTTNHFYEQLQKLLFQCLIENDHFYVILIQQTLNVTRSCQHSLKIVILRVTTEHIFYCWMFSNLCL